MSMNVVLRFALVVTASLMLAGCPGGGSDIIPAMKQLPPEAQVLLAKKGMKQETPIFVRIFKEESELEIWKQKEDGRFYHFKTYPICAWSGGLGPKVKVGDKQAPEGFYTVTPGQMNPNSQFHLAFNLGFPNAYDRAHGRTGDALMVHGDCRSAGCFAMTDALIEEIYILAREAFQGGQRQFQVHAFPFRMTDANLARYKTSQWYDFWKQLKEGYDSFEKSQIPPKVNVCSGKYLLNASFFGQEAVADPQAACPAYKKIEPQPFDPFNQNGPTLIQAKAQPQPQPAEATRVAAVAAESRPAEPAAQATHSAGEQPRPASTPAPVLAGTVSLPRPAAPAAVAPQHTAAAPAEPAPAVAPHNVQPVAVTYPPQPAAPAEPASKKPLETRGLHNVVESGKSDMIIVPRAQAEQPAAPSAQYTFGQANTAVTAPAIR
jgi:murein L,D-transpeptidase YafK